jgi:hypothetical protein
MTNYYQQIISRQGNRGIALIMTLLLLSLFTVMTLSMVIATTSDTLIDGYYRNARGSFYGADSGVNAVRQALLNDLYNNNLPAGYVPSHGAPSLTIGSAFPSDITSAFGSSYTSILGSPSSSSSASWPGTFELNTSSSSLTMTPSTANSALCNAGSTTAITTTITCTYNYNYHIVVDGQSRSGEVNVVEEYGTIPYVVNMVAVASPPVPLSSWATLLNSYAICSGAFVPGTMSGKMFSNDSWNFGTAGKYIFGGNVGAHDADVGYMYSDGTCDQSSSSSDSHGGTTINPTFSGGLSVGQPVVALPTDTFSQEQAVLDGAGLNSAGQPCGAGGAACTQPTSAALAAVLQTSAGTAYSSSATTGVFLPYNKTTKTLNLNSTTGAFGGIYVQGNVAQMTLTASTAVIGTTTYQTQVTTIVQGSTTTTVTVALPLTPGSPSTGFTRIQDSSSNDSGWMAGSPSNLTVSPQTEGLMVYVTGNISSNPSTNTPTGLSGPSSGPAIQNGSGVTITSGGTISITGNLTYATEPVSLSVADTAVSPAPTNVLGIYTNGGNIQLQPPTNVSTLEIDASIATINGSSGSSYGIQATWNTITNVNIVGGRVQNQALNGSSVGARNIYYDTRFANGFSPPWFPATFIAGATTESATPATPVANRTSWVNTSAQ